MHSHHGSHIHGKAVAFYKLACFLLATNTAEMGDFISLEDRYIYKYIYIYNNIQISFSVEKTTKGCLIDNLEFSNKVSIVAFDSSKKYINYN